MLYTGGRFLLNIYWNQPPDPKIYYECLVQVWHQGHNILPTQVDPKFPLKNSSLAKRSPPPSQQ